jgi:hypothetical protein
MSHWLAPGVCGLIAGSEASLINSTSKSGRRLSEMPSASQLDLWLVPSQIPLRVRVWEVSKKDQEDVLSGLLL